MLNMNNSMRQGLYVLLLLMPYCLWAGDFDGVARLAKRRVPWLANKLVFAKVTHEGNREAFQLQTKNGKLIIVATGPNAAAVGLNWYLKYYCHRSMSHMGDNLSPVSPLPVVREAVTIDAAAQYRFALNYCTYNYTMSFYNWNDWERELDWMALNGVNLMLVANGHEAVWQNVLRRMGYTEKEITDFITGAAYNAWWLMGNIEGWGGPMPQSQIDSRKVLVQKMLARMQTLGIEPVMPGFYGMVPHNFNTKTTGHVISQGTWGAFTRPAILDPTDTAFNRVAGIFYEETKKLYGKDIRFFSGDPFHEGGITQGVNLAKAGAGIQKAMQQQFPGSIWVLQGWQDNPKKELLAETDRSTLLIQELFGENTNNWETRNGYESTPFIWCCVNNFGERPGLNGKLERYAGEVYRATTGLYKEYMKGVGIMPEGINNNPVSYELVLELGWHKEQVAIDKWIADYILARYGKYNKDIANAWKLFLQTIYSNPGYQEGPPENVLCARPALQIRSVSSWGNLKKGYDTALFVNAVKSFAAAAPLLSNSETYKIDLINFTRQVLANRADKVFADVVSAYNEKNVESFNTAAKSFLTLHDLTNDLLNSHSYYRLISYQQQALRAGNTGEEKKNNLHNAMMLITYWGENNHGEDNLHEYAYKEWAGLMTSFYQLRWKLYFDQLRNTLAGKTTTALDFFTWEREWVRQNEQVKTTTQPYPALEKVVKKILFYL
jgi:alpha-N-acetylglucosaminidase